MPKKMLKYAEIQSLYPDEWVLLDSPLLKGARVLKGRVIYHHKDKRNVCEFAQTVIHNFKMVKIAFTGEISKISRLGIFKVIESQ
jgi:hypothetical protein